MTVRITAASTIAITLLGVVVACTHNSEDARSTDDALCMDSDDADDGVEAEDAGDVLVPSEPATDEAEDASANGIKFLGPPPKPITPPSPPKPVKPANCPPNGGKPKTPKKDAGPAPVKDAGPPKDGGSVDCATHCATNPPGPGVLCDAAKLKDLTDKVNTACKTPGQKVSCNDQMGCTEIVQILDHADACAAARLARQKCFDQTCRVTCDKGNHDAQAQQYAQNAYGCKDLCLSKSCGTDLCKLKHLASF